MKRVLCVGDACADIVIPYGSAKLGGKSEPQFVPGGTVANTASGLGRLGAGCAFLGKAGNDYYGMKMRDALQHDGVDTSRFELSNTLPSAQVLVVVDETSERFPFLMPRENPSHLALYPEDLPDSLLKEFDFVHTSGLMLFENPAAESVCDFLERCCQHGTIVSIDVNLRVETLQKDTQYLRRALACADYLMGSAEDELIPLSGYADADSAAKSLVTDKRAVISRLGAKGATVYTSSGEAHCDGFPVAVADTLGAGDCYNSGFLFALARGDDLAFANACGCAAAAINLTKPGARNCPTQGELFAFLESRGISI